MSIIIKHIIRNIKEHKASALLMLISLGLASAIFYLSLNLSSDLVSVSEAMMNSSYAGYDFYISSEEGDFEYSGESFEGMEYFPVISESEEEGLASVILVKAEGDIDIFESELKCRFPDLSVNRVDERIDVNKQLNSIRSVLIVMISMTAAMSFYIIKAVSTQILDERQRAIASFRSIGAKKRDIVLILLAENSIYGFAGGLAGFVIGELIRTLLISVYYHSDAGIRHFNISFILLEFAFALVFQISVTLSSIIKASRLSIREAVINTPKEAYKLPVLKIFIGFMFSLAAAAIRIKNHSYSFYLNVIALALAVAGTAMLLPLIIKFISDTFSKLFYKLGKSTLYLSFKDLFSSKSGVFGITLCALVSSLMIVISMSISSINTYFSNYEKSYPYDIFIKGAELDAQEYDFTADIPGIERIIIEFWDYGDWIMNDEPCHLCMVKRDGYSGTVTIDEEKEASLSKGHAFVDAIFARQYGIEAGDSIYFKNPGKEADEGCSEGFTVVVDGFCDTGFINSDRNSVILSDEDYFENVEKSPALIGAVLEESCKTEKYLELLEREIYKATGENVRIVFSEEYVEAELQSARDALKVLGALPACAVFMAILGIVNNQIISLSRKRREYAVLYSAGISRRKLKNIMLCEICSIYITGSLLGLFMSLWFSRIFRDAVYSLIAYIDIIFNIKLISAIITAGLFILVAASCPVIKKIDAINIVEEIKYE